MFFGNVAMDMITRVFLEKVDGYYQGVCFPFFSGGVEAGNHVIFDSKGSLFIGKTARGWAGGKPGLQKLSWSGIMPMDILSISLTKKGFQINFTKKLYPDQASKKENYTLYHYHYPYHEKYGSPQIEKTPISIKDIKISADFKSVNLILEKLVPLRIYAIQFQNLKSKDGKPLHTTEAHYTLNRLRKDINQK